ncbi:MAG: 3-oxoacyl-[acyl-carrier-protein] reductase [candidate division KSB1 bacterium]|nr:3-oxoacyl-[acyl-carrier-protein] reductase [candidate division KSB1 bacterium]
MGKLDGKVAVVTGSARGIGRAIALRLAQEGADVVISDILVDEAGKTSQEIEALGRRSLALKTDVSQWTEAEALINQTVEKFGRIDILVNNAGINKDNLLIRMTEEEWDRVLSVNLKGCFNCTKAAAKIMIKQRSGKIINIASVVGIMGNAGQVNYAASKAGIIGLTKSVARELASRGIQVNAVAPGFIETEMTKALPEKAKESFLNAIPLKRAGTPEEVAAVVSFLSSSDSDYVTGQVIVVDGGMLM